MVSKLRRWLECALSRETQRYALTDLVYKKAKKTLRIPNQIHFVFCMSESVENRTFSFVNYLAVVTAHVVNKPHRVWLHVAFEPVGYWWNQIRPYVELNYVEQPQDIFGKPIRHDSHRADIVRLEQLRRHGGIYLDLDVICVNDFSELRSHAACLAREKDIGLCNAVILAEPDAEFLRLWLQSYEDFDASQWKQHSVRRSAALASCYPETIECVDGKAFYYPHYSDPSNVLWTTTRRVMSSPKYRYEMSKRVRRHLSKIVRLKKLKRFDPPLSRFLFPSRWHLAQLKKNYCVHLWDTLWREPYLKHLTPERVLRGQNNFCKLVQSVIAETKVETELLRLANEQACQTKAPSYVIGSGWWCAPGQTSDRENPMGDEAIRSQAFHRLWHQCVLRYANPDKNVIVDSASPVKPDHDGSCEFISLNRNPGHNTRLVGKYCGYTEAVILAMRYAQACRVDYFVYIEQDALIYGNGIIEKCIDQSELPLLLGGASGTPQPCQQSLFVIAVDYIDEFIERLTRIPEDDAAISPEAKFVIAATRGPLWLWRWLYLRLEAQGWPSALATRIPKRSRRYGFLPIGSGRGRPVPFDQAHFYFQHGSRDELEMFCRHAELESPGGE